MMLLLAYNVCLLVIVALTAPIWLVALLLKPKFRAGFWQKCGVWSPILKRRVELLTKEKDQQVLWLHVVSVGELNAASALIETLARRNITVVISTTTATGQALAKKRFPSNVVFYFPFDLPWLIRRTLKAMKVKAVVVLETEIWPNMAWTCKRQKIPLIMMNGRMAKRAMERYERFKWFFKSILSCYTVLAMQSELDANRMRRLSGKTSRLITMGNLKFDSALSRQVSDETLGMLKTLLSLPAYVTPEPKSDAIATSVTPTVYDDDLSITPTSEALDDTANSDEAQEETRSDGRIKAMTVVLASSHSGEEKAFIEMIQRLRKHRPIVAIIAPRHPERFGEVAQLLTDMLGWDGFCKRSALSTRRVRPENVQTVLLDAMGELFSVFHCADLAIVGGSFGTTGGHNPLEPIQAKIPVLFGPSMFHFDSVASVVLMDKAAIQVASMDEALIPVKTLLDDKALYQQTVANGQRVLTQYAGVVQKAVDIIDIVLKTGKFQPKADPYDPNNPENFREDHTQSATPAPVASGPEAKKIRRLVSRVPEPVPTSSEQPPSVEPIIESAVEIATPVPTDVLPEAEPVNLKRKLRIRPLASIEDDNPKDGGDSPV